MVLIGVLLGFRASRPTGWVAVRLVLVVVVVAFVGFVVLDGDVVRVELRVDLVGFLLVGVGSVFEFLRGVEAATEA